MSEDSRVFETGAVRDNADGKGRMDLLPWNAIIELSKHCERGAKHYGENNVRKGIPFHSLADSGARHLAKWIAGITDEPTHLVAACWNLMWLLEQTITRPELNDMPWRDVDNEVHELCSVLIPAIKDEDFKRILEENKKFRQRTESALDDKPVITKDEIIKEARKHLYSCEHPDDKADREKKIAESGKEQ